MTAVEPTTPASRSRRDVLCGLMVALVAPGALVAACSDSEPSGDANTPGSNTPTGGGGTTTPGAAQGLTALADVPDGGGLIVENPDGGVLLIVRTGNEVTAYNAACTHMGTPVQPPEDGVAICPNHGSRFDTATGAVQRGPATQPLATVDVKVEGDQVVLA
ncbi:MAG: Rieske (2Fe-2S) protein [Pseudonocardiaceae bacterium]|nr:Rieske (2Fe-2S) protein [Pseudonocardiaceae bacterium]